MHVREVRPGELQPHRLGAGREDQGVESDRQAAAHFHGVAREIERGRTAAYDLDVVVLVEASRTNWNPLLRRISGEVVLGQIWAVVWRVGVIVDHGHGAGESTASEHLRRRRPRGTSADDHDSPRFASVSSARRSPRIAWR